VEAVQNAVQARCYLDPRHLMIVCAHARGAPRARLSGGAGRARG
jgi:hypothetical protein